MMTSAVSFFIVHCSVLCYIVLFTKAAVDHPPAQIINEMVQERVAAAV
jgi:hypothetical protein